VDSISPETAAVFFLFEHGDRRTVPGVQFSPAEIKLIFSMNIFFLASRAGQLRY
jgi:hypothetical protein